MKHIEVLLIRDATDTIQEVYLRRGQAVLRETVAHFNCRLVRPHQSLYELRYVYREDSRLTEYLVTLHTMPRDYVTISDKFPEAFTEMFLVGTGFYMPDTLAEFD